MSFIITILIGLAAGALAKYIFPGDEPGGFDDIQGIFITIVIGVVGSIVGGFLGGLIGFAAYTLVSKIILATIGALIFLWAYKKIKENN